MNTAIVATGDVNGNIGSCSIKSESYNVDLFHVQTTAVNSCTGKIISQNTMFDSGWLFGVPIVFGICCIGIAILKSVFD